MIKMICMAESLHGIRARAGGGGHSGTERLPTAKRLCSAEAVNRLELRWVNQHDPYTGAVP